MRIAEYVALIGVALAAAIWAALLVPRWARAAQLRAGYWYLEAQLWINGPLIAICIFFYGPEGPIEPFSSLAAGLSWLSAGLGLWSLVQSYFTPRAGSAPLIGALAFFYGALLLSSIYGFKVGVPEAYWSTPLVVLGFIALGGYSFGWLMSTLRSVLRSILALSFVAILAPGQMAFNTDEARILFGVPRLEGITEHPNTLAFVALLAILLELSTQPRSPLWISVAGGALALSQSNTALVTALIVATLMRGRAVPLYRKAVIGGLLVIAALTVVSARFQLLVMDFFADRASLNGRATIWSAAWEGFEEYPIFGYGPEVLGEQRRYSLLGEFDAAAQAHNQVLQSLGSSGIVGTIALVVLVIVLLVAAVRSFRRGLPLPLMLFAALLLRMVTESPLRPTGPGLSTLLLLIVLAVVVTAATCERSSRATFPFAGAQSSALRIATWARPLR